MKNTFKFRFTTAMLAAIFAFGTIDSLAQTRRPIIRSKAPVTKPGGNLYTVRSGERLRVRMNETINSKTARVGDRFTTTVTEPVYSTTGVVVIPTGSTVTGRVDAVKAARKGGDAGEISASFVEVRLPNGTRRAINGSLTDLETKNATSDNEGTTSGNTMKNRKIIFIGGGGAGGAVLGAAIGGGKGAIIGGLLGAGAGLLGERLTKGGEAEVKSGTEFGVYLNQAVSLPRFTESNNSSNENYQPTNNGGGQTYIVQPGDTLAGISRRFYGTTNGYMRIYEANRDRLSSPTRIEVGQELIIP